jgi:dolichol-phosphate mannosyltransferase
MTVELSVVVPVYNAASCMSELHRRLTETLGRLTSSFEIVLVDDGSRDGSWAAIAQLAKEDPRVRALRLSRNFGQHAAITAGLQDCQGAWAVVMDCDLQDPPEEVPRLWQRAQDGVDIVLARRRQRQHSAFRRAAARLYFMLLGLFNRTAFDSAYGTFSIISRRVIDTFLLVEDGSRHYLLMLYWLGFERAAIEYDHGDRFAGHSTYRLRALIKHALDGIFFQTTVFLRWIIYAGFALSMTGLAMAAYIVYRYFRSTALPGWTSLAVLILVVGGCTIISVGVAALYIGKIFEQVKGRPLYVVSRRIIHGVER